MIIFADKIDKLDFSKLTNLYANDIERSRQKNYRRLSAEAGLLRAREDYYLYLCDVFFADSGKFFIFEENSRYVSGVCFETYKDGLLLNSLVTVADARRKGYAEKLVACALKQLPNRPVYAHIQFRNIASMRFHEKLGFSLLHDYAHMLDGSVRSDHLTYIKKH